MLLYLVKELVVSEHLRSGNTERSSKSLAQFHFRLNLGARLWPNDIVLIPGEGTTVWHTW